MRRGRFGRNRGVQSNMTALIAGLMREQRAAQDRVMFDAYSNGGLVDGKPVTDSRLLGYIRTRRNGFDKADPLWAEWDNRATQQEFTIGEQKIDLAFKQGHVGAGAVAAFYRHALSKLPKDSAFYREVAGRAADWSKAAGGAARGRAGGRVAAGTKAKQDAVQKTWADYGALINAVTTAAQRAGLDMSHGVGGVDATDFQALFDRGITGPTGQNITWADWTHATNDAYKGFDTLIAVAEAHGRTHKTLDENKAKFLTDTVIATNTVDDRAKAELATDVWTTAINSAGGDPRAILTANQQYAYSLGRVLTLASSPTGRSVNDAEFIGQLQNTVDAVHGKTPKGDTLDLNLNAPDGHKIGLGEFVTAVHEDADLLASGKGFLGQAKAGEPLRVILYPPAADMDPFGRKGLGPDSQPAWVSVNGKATQVILKGDPISAAGVVDQFGVPTKNVPVLEGGGRYHYIPIEQATVDQVNAAIKALLLGVGTDNEEVIGYVFVRPGGQTTYGVLKPDGSMVFTPDNPFGPSYNLPGGSGHTVLVPGWADVRGAQTQVRPQLATAIPTLPGESNLLIDTTVNAADLRALATNAGDAATAKAYLDAATAQDRRNYSRDNPNNPDAHLTGSVEKLGAALAQPGSIIGLINQGLGAIGDALKPLSVSSPSLGAPPSLKVNRPLSPTMPWAPVMPQAHVGAVPPPTMPQAHVGAVPTLSDGLPAPTTAQVGAAGYGVGSAIGAALEKAQNPPPTPTSKLKPL
jgi:hypothetical protein